MAATRVEIRPGAYFDSVILMHLQAALVRLPGVLDSGVVMGTPANKELLAQSGLLVPEVQAARADDLAIVLRAEDDSAAARALAQVDELLSARRTNLQQEYRPRSLETALQVLPDAKWALISVAGRYAAGVARQALALGLHVFLFSDNVPVEDEVDLKRISAEKALLVMGPDCGTAMVGGTGLAFANKVRRGNIGIVAAAGTGLQQVASRIHQLGGGVSHAIGTGGRDLSEKVGAVTFLQGLDLLRRDPETGVILLVSKPPAAAVAEQVLRFARNAGKPVVVAFVGRPVTSPLIGNLHFARGLDDAAQLAIGLADNSSGAGASQVANPRRSFAPGQKYLRGLFSGGTLAYEAQYILKDYVGQVWANAPLDKANRLANSLISQEHSIVDLGEDEFTVGRVHPMLDNELRLRRMMQETADTSVAVILLDVVLGFGSHPDPSAELAPAIAHAIAQAANDGRRLEVAVVVTGTDEDPQGLAEQCDRLRAAGAWVDTSNEAVVRHCGSLVAGLAPDPLTAAHPPIDVGILSQPLRAINFGLESFASNLQMQGAEVVHVDWRPPAGGNERLAAILARMKQ